MRKLEYFGRKLEWNVSRIPNIPYTSFFHIFLILPTLKKNKPSGSHPGVYIFINAISTQIRKQIRMAAQSHKWIITL